MTFNELVEDVRVKRINAEFVEDFKELVQIEKDLERIGSMLRFEEEPPTREDV